MPPLTAQSPILLHILQNLGLIALALVFAPLLTLIAVGSSLVAPHLRISHDIQHAQRWRRTHAPPHAPPRTVLVTGVGMSKGLALARAFHRAGHVVIGADVEPHRVPVCGRFSAALARFHVLRKDSPAAYVADLTRIARHEAVALWVSCSGVASAVEDGLAKEALAAMGVPAVQFDAEVTRLLHEKDTFIENTKRLGLNVPETHRIHSAADALAILHPDRNGSSDRSLASNGHRKTYILKPIGLDDSIRADMTQLPLADAAATRAFLTRLGPSAARPFVLQEFVRGAEYCTHALAVRGEIKAFAACASAELLMHYAALPATTRLFRALLRYTELYAARMGPDFSGHFSLDVLVPGAALTASALAEVDEGEEESREPASGVRPSLAKAPVNGDHGGMSREEGTLESSSSTTSFPATPDLDAFHAEDPHISSLLHLLTPIECNPRAHTATLLLTPTPHPLSAAYLSLLPSSTSPSPTTAAPAPHILVPPPATTPIYWIGHDLVTRGVLPLLRLLALRRGPRALGAAWLELAWHVCAWKDGTWEVWDPWPLWWLYVVYWPGMFGLCLLRVEGWWSRCNVGTTKMFRC